VCPDPDGAANLFTACADFAAGSLRVMHTPIWPLYWFIIGMAELGKTLNGLDRWASNLPLSFPAIDCSGLCIGFVLLSMATVALMGYWTLVLRWTLRAIARLPPLPWAAVYNSRMFGFFRDRRRRKLLAEPFPPHWEVVLKRNVGHYPRLSEPERAKLRDVTRVLVAEKMWEGCGGQFITDEIKLTVAAQAALLLIGQPDHDHFSRVQSVIVYPDEFRTPRPEDGYEDDGLSETTLDGQAWYRGPVIVGWKQALEEGRDPAAGYNVVLHEFAHQLDFLDGESNGTPPLGDRAAEARWRDVMTAAFDDHRRMLNRGEETFFTEHAADDETEFFADATEAFYCRPHDLRGETPEVFDLLRGYFRVNPLVWFSEADGR
jgi:hypothetical protein